MTNREANSREQFEKAGQQAAQVLGRFMSIATEFSNEFNRNTRQDTKPQGDAENNRPTNDSADILREAGEELQKMREAAGYTLDSFAAALKKQINRSDIDDSDVVVKVEAAESGQKPLPDDWLNQVAALLNSGDPLQLFAHLQKNDDAHAGTVQPGQDQSNVDQSESVQTERVKKFAALFKDDDDLASCTDEQFEKLLGFVEKNYQEAKNLVISK